MKKAASPKSPQSISPESAAAVINRATAPCLLTVAANSLKVFLNADTYPESSDTDQRYLWIDPPWRWTRDGSFILGSSDAPHPDEFEEDAEYKAAFKGWLAKFEPLREAIRPGIQVQIARGVPDLTIGAGEGHQIEVFINTAEWLSWHYEDFATAGSIHADPSGVWQQARTPDDS